jgi:hypothetical protein
MIELKKENKEQLLPIIKEAIPSNEIDLHSVIDDFIRLDEILSQINSTNPIIIQTYDDFFVMINDFIEKGRIVLPEDTEQLIIEKKNTLTGQNLQTPKSTYNFKKKQELQSWAATAFDQSKKNPLTGQKNDKNHPESSNHNQTLQQKQKAQTTRSTYALTNFDRSDIKELDLPKDKIYIYKELRKRFGRPVDVKILETYGINRFARMLENKYPGKFKRTTIKMLIATILEYDKLLKE